MASVASTRPPASGNKEPTPRPIGVDPSFPWEPREPVRDYTYNLISTRFIEWIMESEQWQAIGAAIVGAYARHFVKDNGTPGANVPSEPGSWMFAGIGDYGSGTAHSAGVAANVKRGHPSLVITVGDNVYPTGRWQDYQKNFDPPRFYGDLVHRIPFMPSVGNHDEIYEDDLRPYFAHFPQLKGKPYYAYTFRNAHFMALDGDEDLRPGSTQYRWLENELKHSHSTWRVVYMHYPMYCEEVGSFKEFRSSLQPLLKKYHVQLMVTGHVHNYQRTFPIEGTTHIITGNAGQEIFASTKRRDVYTAFRSANYGHVEFSVGPTKMVVRAISEKDGKVFDTTVIPAGIDQLPKQPYRKKARRH
jgi:hypothetical protein